MHGIASEVVPDEYLVIARKHVVGQGESYITGTETSFLRALAVANTLEATGWTVEIQSAAPVAGELFG